MYLSQEIFTFLWMQRQLDNIKMTSYDKLRLAKSTTLTGHNSNYTYFRVTKYEAILIHLGLHQHVCEHIRTHAS